MAFDHISDLTLKFGYQDSSNSVPVLGGDGRISHNKNYRLDKSVAFIVAKSNNCL